MAKVLLVAGLLAFWAALLSELAFIMLRVTEASGTSTASPNSIYGLVVWGCIGTGALCWTIGAVVVVTGFLKSRR